MHNYKRRAPTRLKRDRILIMCGGKTERVYFEHFKNKYGNYLQNVHIVIVAHDKSTPSAVVKEALSRKGDYDEVWAVFDKDEFRDFDDAIAIANDGGVHCAFSNEAIEYWFFLHFDDKGGAMSRSKLSNVLGTKLGFNYSKKEAVVRRVCKKIDGKLSCAEERAKTVHEQHLAHSGSPSDWCSCTTIYILTKKLREWNFANR